MNTRIVRRSGALALVAALALGAAACDDDPTGLDDDHGDPDQVVLLLNGVQIASATAINVGTTTGEIHLEPGEETNHIDVVFLDEEGDPITFDDDFYLEVEVGDEAIAEFEQDTPGEFGGHAHGKVEGETTLTLHLGHIDHRDWSSAEIRMHVEP